MKRKIIFGLCILATIGRIYAQSPEWVTTHPVSDKAYVGIGMASMSEPDYIQKATHNALADIASQIAIKVESNSLLHTVDVDGRSREMFEEKIRGTLTSWIEGHELKNSYQSGNTYYVYYTLDKATYKKNTETKREKAIRTGMDYLNKGRDAEEMNNLVQAAQLYCKGLETVEAWMFMELTTIDGGRQINVPIELYHALTNVFSGMAITTNTIQIEGEPFKPVTTPIAGCLSKNGAIIPNIILKLTFIKGNGDVSAPIQTDHTGTAEFYVTNITSKQPVQELNISIDDSFLSTLPELYRKLVTPNTWPSAKITLTLKSTPTTAYLYINDNHDLEGAERQLSSLLTNNYFSLTEDPDAATCFIDLSSSIEMGNVESGGTYDLNTCYCTLTLKIYNNTTQELLLDYSANDVKVLVPTNKSATQSISMCVREVMKRVNRDLPKQLKTLSIQ